MEVLNFGSLNIDYVYSVDHFVSPGETLSADNMQIYPGGKGLNQSIAIARAGGNVIHAGIYGRGGVFLRNILQDNDINTSNLNKLDVPNGHAIIQVDKYGENSILLYGGTNEMIDEGFIDNILDNAVGDEIVLFQNEISSIAYAMKKAKELGCKIAFNPAPMNKKVLEYPLSLVDILVVNQTEGEALSGQKQPNAILERLKHAYPQTKIILTLGADGSWFTYNETTFHIPSYKVERVVDTTAAGDTFIGYYLANISNGIDDIQALKYASKAAAICVTREGAAVSIPYNKEL